MKKYDLTLIMKRAWRIYRSMFNMTFGKALKESWRRVKCGVEARVESAKRSVELKAKNAARDYRNYRAYYGSRVGRDDWKRDFCNDTRMAIRRSIELSRINA